MKLLQKASLLMLVVGFVPLIVFAVFFVPGLDRSIRERTIENLYAATNQGALEIGREIDIAFGTVRLLADDFSLLSVRRDRENIEQTLTNALRLTSRFRDISVLNARGVTIASVHYSFIGDWRETSWYLDSLRGKVVFSDIHSVLYPYDNVYTIAIPMIGDSGDVNGVVIAEADTDQFNEIGESVSESFDVEFYVINENGIIISSNNPDKTLELIRFGELTNLGAGYSDTAIRATDAGKTYLAAIVEIPREFEIESVAWYAVSLRPVLDAFAPIYSTRSALWLVFAISIGLVAILSYAFAKNQTNRVKRLADLAHRIGSGEFVEPIVEQGRDEISDLTSTLNATSEQLRASTLDREKALNQLATARDELEDRVAERTVDLQREMDVRKQAVADALEEKNKAERANKAKSDFLANMSHELRTPLNHIIGFVELAKDSRVGTLNHTQEEYLIDSLGSSKHLLQMINEILDLSKVETGKMTLNFEPFNLKEMLETCIRSVEGQAKIQNINMRVSFVGRSTIASGDAGKLTQVIHNMVSNALKFTPTGGSITILGQMRDDDGLFKVSVEDTGIGIAEKDLLQSSGQR